MSLNDRVNPPAPKNLALVPASNKGLKRPGTLLAVCYHCGLCNSSFVKCSRCETEFPVDVKLIPDSWWSFGKVEESGPTKPVILRPPQRTEQKGEETEKKMEGDQNLVTKENALNSSPSKADFGDMRRRIVPFNFTSPLEESPKEPDDISPGQVWQRIETEMDSPHSKLEFAIVEVRSVRIGSYKVTSTDVGIPLIIVFTKLGITFYIPHATMKHRRVKICIPHEVILGMRVHFGRKLPVIFLNSGPNFARWIRNELGLDGCPHNESINYYCPVDGNACQRTIAFLADSVADQDVGLIKSMYEDVITEINYMEANNALMNSTPEAFKTSIGLRNEAAVQIPLAKVKKEPPPPITTTSTSNSMNYVRLTRSKTVQNRQSPAFESPPISSGKSTKTVGTQTEERGVRVSIQSFRRK